MKETEQTLLDQIKDQVSREKGYDDWETMENWYIDHNFPSNIAVLLTGSWKLVCERYYQAKAKASCEAKWISVKDRLPEFHQRVMISFIVELTGDVLLKVDYCFKYHNNDVEWKHTDSKSVTHWQPLPSAPTLQGREPGRDSLQFTDPKNIIIL